VALLCFSFWLRVLDLAVYSAFESTLISSIVSYRIVGGWLHTEMVHSPTDSHPFKY